MTCTHLPASALRLTIDPDALGFVNTTELLPARYPWIGQARAQTATHFGLTMDMPDYNLFVLGDVGCGHAKLLRQAMEDVAAQCPVPPDLCYLYNFDTPDKPHALRMPAGEGCQLRTLMTALCKTLQQEIPLSLQNPRFVAEQEKIQKAHDVQEAGLYDQLNAYAEAHDFVLRREQDRLVFTYRGEQGHALSELEMLALSPEQRAKINQQEQALHIQINHFFDQRRPMERALNDALAALKRQTIEPLLEHELKELRSVFKKSLKNVFKLSRYLDQVSEDILKNVELFQAVDSDDALSTEALDSLLARYRVNLVVDNRELTGAPVIVEDNPLYRQLFGSVEYQSEEDVLITDFSRIRAGSLLKANGGYLLLELEDLLSDPLVWEKLRRFLRSGRLQIEEPGRAYAANAVVSLEPEPVDVSVKLVLIGSADEYYALQSMGGDFVRHFLVKVDFAEPVPATDQTRRATAELIAHTCSARMTLPFSAAGVSAVLEAAHRAASDQLRQTANAAFTEELVMESSALARAQNKMLVGSAEVASAIRNKRERHNYPEQTMHDEISEGTRLLTLEGQAVGQINGLTVVDLGDYCFGSPVRVTSRTFAGTKGVLNLEREVEMSGPIHDKGVLILHSYVSSLFSHLAPLALTASIVFEQEYFGVEGDSASCAELFVLLSALADVPINQSIAVTGALNQRGEVLPVGGINDKIEGYFRVCAHAGLNGSQGVLIPERNSRHLMLDQEVVDAVSAGLFHIYTMRDVTEGLALLSGLACGEFDMIQGRYPEGTIFGRAQAALFKYRELCQRAQPDACDD